MAYTLHKSWRHILVLGWMFGALGVAMAQMPQGVSAQGLQLPQALQGAAGGLSGGVGGGLGGALGPLGIAGAFQNVIRATDPVSEEASNPASKGAFQPMEPLRPNDFQKFVLETTGYKLPLFGSSFFENLQFVRRNELYNQPGPSPFTPTQTSPVSAEYLIGPGDQVLIRGWGSLEMEVRAVVDRNGMVNIPKVGSVPLAGVKFAQAENVIKSAVGKYFKDFQLSVTMGQLRSITVYVVGQARRPGSYALSSTSTLSTGLFATGGPNATGSMRRVQLKRAGQVVAEFDLYAFLAQGNSVGDVKLVDGDVIVIPQAVGHVALVGKVNNPAVYELKSNTETLEQLLAVAGGLPVVADPRRAVLERLSPEQNQPRRVQDVALNAAGLKTTLANGDMVTVQAITPELGNAVTLRGNVAQPTRMAWREGMRVRDLIPSKEVLISRDSVRRQNEVLFDANQRERALRERELMSEDLLDDPVLDARIDQKGLREARLKEMAAAEKPQPMVNQLGSVSTINLKPTGKEYDGRTSTAEREARTIEAYRESRQARMFSNQPPIRVNERNSVPSLAESVGNLYDEINWDYAVIERINRKDLTISLVPFSLARMLNNDKDTDNQLLQAGDVITVFSVNDMRVPASKRRIMVRVEGEVSNPGIYQAKPGDTLATVLQRAGGLTHDAYLYGSAFYREDVRKTQVDNLDKLVRRLEAESSAQLAQASQSLGATSDAAISQARILAAQQAQRQALERIRSLKPEGRIALGLEPQLYNYIDKLPDIRLQNGDRFIIPARPDFVYVYGAVNTESALIYKSGQTVKDYLNAAGVGTGADRNSVILIRADGSALTSNGGVFGSINNTKVMPGDAIVMPDKLDREATWSAVIRNAKDITQIFYQLGLGAAGLKALGY
jgi:protein involved in polysaccharide export with SLBB domain